MRNLGASAVGLPARTAPPRVGITRPAPTMIIGTVDGARNLSFVAASSLFVHSRPHRTCPSRSCGQRGVDGSAVGSGGALRDARCRRPRDQIWRPGCRPTWFGRRARDGAAVARTCSCAHLTKASRRGRRPGDRVDAEAPSSRNAALVGARANLPRFPADRLDPRIEAERPRRLHSRAQSSPRTWCNSSAGQAAVSSRASSCSLSFLSSARIVSREWLLR